MPIVPFIPLIATGVSAVAGHFAAKKAQAAAGQRSPEELAALSGVSGAASNLTRQGQGLTTAGMPAVQGATNYWSTLLHGNRSQMSLATAGPRAALTDQYRGAERGLERSGVRGGVGDLARAELSRQRAGQIGSLTTGVQPGAAGELGNLGTNLVGQGTSALQGVGDLYGGLLNQGYQNRVYARDQGQQSGKAIGSLIFDVLKGTAGAKWPGGSTKGQTNDWQTGIYS